MSERASFTELLEFANKVRKAGGGNPLDALMPAVPQDPEQCLIAKNLNFNCLVAPADDNDDGWVMYVDDQETRDKIAASLCLETGDNNRSESGQPSFGVLLPEHIGQVAEDFDRSLDDIRDASYAGYTPSWWRDADRTTDQRVANMRDMAPYIEASIRETFDNGTFNDKGELIL